MKIYYAIICNESIDEKLFKQFKTQVKYNYLTIFDDNYPIEYKNQEYPPFLIFYEGNQKLINQEFPRLNFNKERTPRNFTELNKIKKGNKEVYDFLVVSEGYRDLEEQIKLLKSKSLKLIKYPKSKRKER